MDNMETKKPRQTGSGRIHAPPPHRAVLYRKSRRDVTAKSEIRAAARKFIERFGAEAPHQAAMRADELLSLGDYQGRTRWQLIHREVTALLAAAPDRG